MRYTEQSSIVQFKLIPLHRLPYSFDILNIKSKCVSLSLRKTQRMHKREFSFCIYMLKIWTSTIKLTKFNRGPKVIIIIIIYVYIMSGNNNEHKNCFVSYHFIYILSYHIIINQSINQSNLFI